MSGKVGEKEAVLNVTSRILQSIGKKLFPTETRTHGGLHRLRASHAGYLLSIGLSLPQVANQLGDSIVVTIVRVSGDQVRLGIEAPPDILVLREELDHAKCQEPNRRNS